MSCHHCYEHGNKLLLQLCHLKESAKDQTGIPRLCCKILLSINKAIAVTIRQNTQLPLTQDIISWRYRLNSSLQTTNSTARHGAWTMPKPDLHTKTVLNNTAALSMNSAKKLIVRHSTQLLLINTKNLMKIGWTVKRLCSAKYGDKMARILPF